MDGSRDGWLKYGGGWSDSSADGNEGDESRDGSGST